MGSRGVLSETCASPTLLLLALVAGLLAAPTASAKPGYRVGMGDQNKKMFANKSFKALELKRLRYIVSWDAGVDARQFGEVGGYLLAARPARKEVLVAFGARRGCFTGRYAAAKRCRAPSLRAYRSAFRAFRKRYPWVKTFSPWNEANQVSQPTYRRPGLAAAYYDQVRRNCRGCKIVALDVLDSRNMLAYIGGFMRGTKGKPQIWGIHNYADVNRLRSSATRAILRRVPGEVWMTETGGLVAFGPSFRTTSGAPRRGHIRCSGWPTPTTRAAAVCAPGSRGCIRTSGPASSGGRGSTPGSSTRTDRRGRRSGSSSGTHGNG